MVGFLSGGPRPLRPRSVALRLGIGSTVAVLLGVLVLSVVPVSLGPGRPLSAQGTGAVRAAVSPAHVAPQTTGALPFSIDTVASPTTICAAQSTQCTVGLNSTRVTLSMNGTTPAAAYWPDVQVAFVIETTGPDGVEDHNNCCWGSDPCAASTAGQGPVCEESNGVPFFVANAGNIAGAIAGANPHTNVSFAMVDFFGTDYNWNDGPLDSWKYSVAVPQFVPAPLFGAAVRSGFQSVKLTEANGWACECALDDNFLHSSSITALYGAIIGSGLDWSPNTHHVIVLMGSTAPRAVGYQQNYWVSAVDKRAYWGALPGPYSETCEPAYQFSEGSSPNCEGWVVSQDGNPDDSIAALTRTAPTCTDSVGHQCIIDVIDYWDTPTDPYSQGWPLDPPFPSGSAGAGPGGASVLTDSSHILEAGCALAEATGGTWDGPAFWTCANGQSGTLQYVPHGPLNSPNTNNPTLLAALRQISFGPIHPLELATGGPQPMFTYVPPTNFAVSSSPDFAAACYTPAGYLPTCQVTPTVEQSNGITYLGWNWSTNATQNTIFLGDSWTASFNIVNTGPPYADDPVLSCTTVLCRAAGSGARNGLYSWATVLEPNTSYALTASFPLAVVEPLPAVGNTPPSTPPPTSPPPPPGVPVGLVPAPPVTPAPPAVIGQGGFGAVSIQAAAAGFLGAGFTRVGIKQRPIALSVANKSGAPKPSGPGNRRRPRPPGPIGRFE